MTWLGFFILMYVIGGASTILFAAKHLIFKNKRDYEEFKNGEYTLPVLCVFFVFFTIWPIVVLFAVLILLDDAKVKEKISKFFSKISKSIGAMIGPPILAILGLFISQNFEDEDSKA